VCRLLNTHGFGSNFCGEWSPNRASLKGREELSSSSSIRAGVGKVKEDEVSTVQKLMGTTHHESYTATQLQS